FNLPEDLEYRPPSPLLKTEGLTWDYQKSDDFVKILKNSVADYYSTYKEGKLDKTTTPLYFMASGAGSGKSHNATELPN
ncbi:1710_t:CDS:1, partial [Paraglomus occultum]